MISSPRHVLKTPNSRPNVTDLGNFVAIGSNIFTKAMLFTGVDRTFEPVNTHGGVNDLGPYLYGYNRSTTPFQFKGTNCPNIYPSNSSIETSLSAQAIGGDSFSPYFDSTQGSTAGNRYIMLPGSELAQVQSDGTITTIFKNSPFTRNYGNVVESYAYIFGENSTSFFVYDLHTTVQNNTNSYHTALYRVTKGTWVTTPLSPACTSWAHSAYRQLRFMGITTDNKAFFVSHPTIGVVMTANTTQYWVVDLVSGAFSYGTAYSLGQQASAVNCCAAPSSMTPDIQSPSHFKYYYPVVDPSVATPVSIRRCRVPQTIGAYVTPTASDVAVCSFVGGPVGFVIPNPSANPTVATVLSECDLFTIQSNGSEYIVVINHAMGNNYAGTNTNGCSAERHIVAVFMVDPTDSTKLIYQSHLAPEDLGSSMVFGALNTNSDRTLIVLSNNGGFIALKWSPSTARFIVSKFYGVSNISRISVDSLDQIWIENTGGALYVFQLDNSVNVEITFAGNAQTVSYIGTPITIDAIVNAYTLAGNRAIKQVTLSLEGATFTAGGTNTAVVTTSDTVDTMVNITISSAGEIVITPTSVV